MLWLRRFIHQNLPIIMIGLLFFIFGFITWLNGTLIPFLRLACDLQTDWQALLVTFSFYMAYFFLSLPSALIIEKTGYKKGISLGLVIMSVGSCLFIPAAHVRSFELFLIGLFIQGMGLALLQSASNPYVAMLGPIRSAARRISIMGVCNKVGGAISPLILSFIVFAKVSAGELALLNTQDSPARDVFLQQLADRVIVPYLIMALFLLALSLIIWFSSFLDANIDDQVFSDREKGTSLFSFPHLWLGLISIFLYVGVEVMSGDGITIYGRSLGLELNDVKYLTSYTLWCMVCGYIVGIYTIPKYISQEKALSLSALLALLLSIVAFFSPRFISVQVVAFLGFAHAVMWPAIFPLAINGLGKLTKRGSAILVMGISGGAIIPQCYGYLNEIISPRIAFFGLMIPCYLFIFYFSVWGRKVKKNHDISS